MTGLRGVASSEPKFARPEISQRLLPDVSRPRLRIMPSPTDDARRHAPAAARNCSAIIEAMDPVLPIDGHVLEIASGSGQHVTAFADHFPKLTWQPSDPDPSARSSIAAWAGDAAATNILAPLNIDTTDPDWPHGLAEPSPDIILAINLVHISPWAATEGLFKGANLRLSAEGCVCLYGPYIVAGQPTAPSNQSFDASLRAQNPAWGVRHLDALITASEAHGLALSDTTAMPANNLFLVFRRATA
jgi:hypothetical protein